jgi:hypothetical protein
VSLVMPMSVLVLFVGVFFMVGSFFLEGVRGAFSGGQFQPASGVHKAIFFLIGLALVIKAILMFIRAHG